MAIQQKPQQTRKSRPASITHTKTKRNVRSRSRTPQSAPNVAPTSMSTALASPGESFLNALYNGMTEAVLAVNVATRQIVYWNSRAEALFGYTQEEILQRTTKHLYLDEDAFQRLYDASTPVILEQGYWRGEAEFRRQDGSRFLGEVTFSTFLQTGQDDAFAVVVLRDISEHRRIEAQLRERDRLSVLGISCAKIAHEISNPLNGIAVALQVMQRDAAGAPESVGARLREDIDDVQQQIHRLQSLLRELRHFTRPLELVRQPTKLADIVAQVLHTQRARYETLSLTIEQHLPDDLPLVMVDQEKLAQVFLNLVNNAIDAMPSGGVLTLRGIHDATCVSVEVQDNGAGIPSGLDVYAPFVTTKGEGMGLGLAIVKQIVEAHGGSIEHESIAGQGTTFRVTFPLPPATASERA